MPKVEVPESVLDSIAGAEMVKLRKENKRLQTKIEKLEREITSNKWKAAKAEQLYTEIRNFAEGLSEDFGKYWDE